MFFDNYPEFITNDSRSQRQMSPVTAESLTNRHEALLPPELVKGCRVLDLGSCYGASGQWCLAHGATHYTGVEIQREMANKSQELLTQYWDNFKIINTTIDNFLETNTDKYDITIIFGVLYAFLDQYGLLKKISTITNKIIVVDTIYPRTMMTADDTIIEVMASQHINSTSNNTAYSGVGACISPAAMRLLMATLGFEDHEGVIYPTLLSTLDVHDSYNHVVSRNSNVYKQFPMRFLLRFKKGNTKLKAVKDAIESNDITALTTMRPKPVITSAPWVFDDTVANRYNNEATTHIPDYYRVIDLCVACANTNFKKTARLIDVGSADGNTVARFVAEGYENAFGVESSPAMFNISKHQDKITLSDDFPVGEWDIVLANWTLHFVANRRQYLQNIYDNMAGSGMLILSDKMAFTDSVETLYDNFKRSNNIPDVEITTKKKMLTGVLITKPISWYINTLTEIGFTDIQVINANLMFNTLYARKVPNIAGRVRSPAWSHKP